MNCAGKSECLVSCNCGSVVEFKGKSKGESRIYCSDECKSSCDTYHSINTPKSLRNVKAQSRCNQSINRKQLLLLQMDDCGHNYCEKCGATKESNGLTLHHNIMVSMDHTEADNMSHQILVCEKCHTHEGC